jgi:transglutaminase-like putative cysteine protease
MERYYSIRHVTRYRYTVPVRESVMQLYMQPRSDGGQWLRSFQVVTQPRAQLFAYADHLGNAVYHFDVSQEHSVLLIDVESTIEMGARPAPPEAVAREEWAGLDQCRQSGEHFDMLLRAGYTQETPLLHAFMQDHRLEAERARAQDPLTALKRLSAAISDAFDYEQEATTVESAIDHVLETRRGVCQDFAHLMLSVARGWGVPCRYVSGYLFHREDSEDRSAVDASHAWVEAFLPSLGWVGFDPTNNTLALERHIRVAIGRDYADVPPSKGVYKGANASELAVAVKVSATRAPDRHEDFLRIVRPMRRESGAEIDAASGAQAQHQAEQQQQ